jgi:hypothetical protein
MNACLAPIDVPTRPSDPWIGSKPRSDPTQRPMDWTQASSRPIARTHGYPPSLVPTQPKDAWMAPKPRPDPTDGRVPLAKPRPDPALRAIDPLEPCVRAARRMVDAAHPDAEGHESPPARLDRSPAPSLTAARPPPHRGTRGSPAATGCAASTPTTKSVPPVASDCPEVRVRPEQLSRPDESILGGRGARRLTRASPRTARSRRRRCRRRPRRASSRRRRAWRPCPRWAR